MAYHYSPDCSQCCELGRCHWCLTRPGPVKMFWFEKGIHVCACDKHARLVKESDRFPQMEAVGYDGTLRPIELVIDEEAAARRHHALYDVEVSTPATLR